jgi:hypothetical protein
MTQRNGDIIDQVFWKLARAPSGLDASNKEVLVALGLLAQTILNHAYADPVSEAQLFCGALMASVDPEFKARLAQQQRSTEMVTQH